MLVLGVSLLPPYMAGARAHARHGSEAWFGPDGGGGGEETSSGTIPEVSSVLISVKCENQPPALPAPADTNGGSSIEERWGPREKYEPNVCIGGRPGKDDRKKIKIKLASGQYSSTTGVRAALTYSWWGCLLQRRRTRRGESEKKCKKIDWIGVGGGVSHIGGNANRPKALLRKKRLGWLLVGRFRPPPTWLN